MHCEPNAHAPVQRMLSSDWVQDAVTITGAWQRDADRAQNCGRFPLLIAITVSQQAPGSPSENSRCRRHGRSRPED